MTVEFLERIQELSKAGKSVGEARKQAEAEYFNRRKTQAQEKKAAARKKAEAGRARRGG
jgi:uncharacterized protein YoaH (UPF0181 family)